MRPHELGQFLFILGCALDDALCNREYAMYIGVVRLTIQLSQFMDTSKPTLCAILSSLSLRCLSLRCLPIPQPPVLQQVPKRLGLVKRAEDPEDGEACEAWKVSLCRTLGLSGAKMSKRQLMVDKLVYEASVALAPRRPPVDLQKLLEFALLEGLSKRHYEHAMYHARKIVRALHR